MKKEIKVSLIQTDLHWENPEANLDSFSSHFQSLYGNTDLVVIPEMFTTGFSMHPHEIASGAEIYAFLQKHASQGGFAIYGSVMFNDQGRFVNRGIFMPPTTHYEVYDKRHTFTLAGENKVYDKGNQPVVVEYLGWKFLLQI